MQSDQTRHCKVRILNKLVEGASIGATSMHLYEHKKSQVRDQAHEIINVISLHTNKHLSLTFSLVFVPFLYLFIFMNKRPSSKET